MEARALQRFVGTSPRKMRIVIDLIRGRSVGEAMNILHFQPKHAAKSAEKVLRSAVSNFQNKDANTGISTDELIVKEVFVNGGASMKRILPAPMGRAYKILKRSHHLTIIVDKRTSKKK
ncbi:MAG: 50S ribosomal protein L22 [Bacteroidota bacterium]